MSPLLNSNSALDIVNLKLEREKFEFSQIQKVLETADRNEAAKA
jgi:hypothetical protein